jgi:predicted DNA-binding mobile mystery protein A
VAEMESSEQAGTLSLRSLQRAAEALDCQLVYAFIPNRGLDEAVREQAGKVAAHRLASVSHSMLLEAQSLSREEEARMLKSKTEELMRTLPRWLWDDF